MDNWTKTTRQMLRESSQIGAKPFILFQYFLTWENAKDGIFPPLKLIAADLDLEPNAICNLRKRLVDAGWIRIEKGQIHITKGFTKNEESTQIMNEAFTENEDSSQKMNQGFIKNESALKGLDIKNSSKNRKKKGTRIADPFPLTSEMVEWVTANIPRLRDVEGRHDDFIEYWTNLTTAKAAKLNWGLTWKKGMRLAMKWQDRDDAAGVKGNGTTIYKSAAERSGDRALANEQFIHEIERGQHADSVARLLGGDDESNIKGYLPS